MRLFARGGDEFESLRGKKCFFFGCVLDVSFFVVWALYNDDYGSSSDDAYNAWIILWCSVFGVFVVAFGLYTIQQRITEQDGTSHDQNLYNIAECCWETRTKNVHSVTPIWDNYSQMSSVLWLQKMSLCQILNESGLSL